MGGFKCPGTSNSEGSAAEFSDDFCSNQGKQTGNFFEAMAKGVLAVTGFGSVIDSLWKSPFDEFKQNVGNVQNDTQQFINQGVALFANIITSDVEMLDNQNQLQEMLTENIINVNNEILHEQITLNTTYIMVTFIILMAVYIFVYIKI